MAFESSEKFLMVDYVNLFLLPNHSMPLHREKFTYLGKQVLDLFSILIIDHFKNPDSNCDLLFKEKRKARTNVLM